MSSERPLRRKVVRPVIGAVTFLPAVVFLRFLAGLLGAIVPSAGEAPGDAVEIRLVGTVLHYDLLLPATPETRAAFAFARRVPVEAPGVGWISVGWGARNFHARTAALSDMRAGTIRRAVTGDAAVLRVDVWGPFAGEGTLRLRLSAAQYGRLLAAILATRSGTGPDGALTHAGFTPTDAFYPARGWFDGLRTCNVRVGAMLRAAGLRFGVWTATPQAIRLSVALHSATS